jgi:hypothetical protein
MSHERPTGLTTLCIEKDKLDEVNVDMIIDDFASTSVTKTRRFVHHSINMKC